MIGYRQSSMFQNTPIESLKSAAINIVTMRYEEEILEPELRPEFVEKIKTLEKKGKFLSSKNTPWLQQEIDQA